jgi:hypothetical protein
MLYDDATKLRLERVELRRKGHGVGTYLNIVFFLSLVTYGITFWTQDNYKAVDSVVSSVYREPSQKDVQNSEKISFDQNGYQFDVDPLFDYEITGFVLSHYDYTFFALRRTDSVFPVDLCLTWGENMKSRSYQEYNLNVRQDSRWCYVNWSKSIDFDMNEVSNNHLVINDKELEKKAFSVRSGDQVRITGKLANVKATNVDGKLADYEFESASWGSSTTRTDSGAGACEVIWVESIEILQRGNEFSYFAHVYSLYLIVLILIAKIIISQIKSYRYRKIRAMRRAGLSDSGVDYFKTYSPLLSLKNDPHATTNFKEGVKAKTHRPKEKNESVVLSRTKNLSTGAPEKTKPESHSDPEIRIEMEDK